MGGVASTGGLTASKKKTALKFRYRGAPAMLKGNAAISLLTF